MPSQRSLTQARKVCEKGEQKSAERLPLVICGRRCCLQRAELCGTKCPEKQGLHPEAILYSAVVALRAPACGCGERVALAAASA